VPDSLRLTMYARINGVVIESSRLPVKAGFRCKSIRR
jgi:hypothetical protein